MERKLAAGPSDTAFATAVTDRKLRRDQEALSLEQVLESEKYISTQRQSQIYLRRLGADGLKVPLFVNGIPIPNDEEWLQAMSQRVSTDLMTIQQGVYEGKYTQEMWLPDVFLEDASPKRSPLIVPEMRLMSNYSMSVGCLQTTLKR